LPHLPTESSFVPYLLSENHILNLVALCADLNARVFERHFTALILVLYCTGIRFGEALRLRMWDVNTKTVRP